MRLLVILLLLSPQQPAPPAPPQQGRVKLVRPVACPSCDLHGANLAKRDLSNENLAYANLSGADLRGANLDGAELVGANLTNANLDGTRLGTTAKGRANLSNANLTGASFRDVNAQGAIFSFANLAGTDFTRADLRDAVFERHIRSGTAGGRKTTFRDARLHRELIVDDLTADVSHVRWLPPRKATGKAFPGEDVVCGTADLSHLTSRIYVANSGTDQPGCGAGFDTACQTISYGITHCEPSGCGVIVQADRYLTTSTIALRDGVNVYGGCNPVGRSTNLDFSAIRGPFDGVPVVSATGLRQGLIFQNFELQATSVGNAGSKPNIVMIANDSQNLSILNSHLVAEIGGAGPVGANGVEGQPGSSGVLTAGGTGPCGSTTGGNGAGPMDVSVDVGFDSNQCHPHCDDYNCWGRPGYPYYAMGGQWGEGNCSSECGASPGWPGKTGETGRNGTCGSSGIASLDMTGSFSGGIWVPAAGGTGGRQLEEPGGGGGGGSGGYLGGSCLWMKYEHPGNVGGGGGAGGCFGTPGLGGKQGGASFSLVLIASHAVLTDVVIVGSVSGVGGTGGVGGRGGPGGSGGIPPRDHDGGVGGHGGYGGAGGAAGGGAGGNSGPSVGIALVTGSTVTETRVQHYLGTAGGVGLGGGGGDPIVPGACVGSTGQNGMSGFVGEQRTY